MPKITICPKCGARPDRGKRCGCQSIDIDPAKIPASALNGAARAVLHEAAEAFKDPAFAADYAAWLAARGG